MRLVFQPVSKETSVLGKLEGEVISVVTRGPYVHCELWIDGDPDAAYCFSATLSAGTRYIIRDVRGWFSILIPGTENTTRSDIYEAVNLVMKSENEPYDVLGLLGFVIPLRTHIPGDVFCSAADIEELEQAKLMDLSKQPWKYSPNDLARWCEEHWGPLEVAI